MRAPEPAIDMPTIAPARRAARRFRPAPFAAVALLAACFSSSPDVTEPDGEVAATVEMTPDLRFSPAVVTIRAGQAVRWRNVSGFVHTATADPAIARDRESVKLPAGAEPFDSGDLTAGGEYEHTFTVPGEYRYFCIPHETIGMVATVMVTPD